MAIEEERPRRRVRPTSNGSGVHSPGGLMTVTRSAYGGPETVTEELIEVPRFQGPVARIRIEGGVTMNMGDYQSSRVTVSVELPSYPEATEIERVGDIASVMVSGRIDREAAKIRGRFSIKGQAQG